MIRLTQITHASLGRRVALVESEKLRLLGRHWSVYELAQAAMETGQSLAQVVEANLSGEAVEYDPIYAGRSEWRLLPAFDHPVEPARCLVSGTGLTHKASAENRQAMHGGEEVVTDSMRMYRWGLEGGKPAGGGIGVPPEWFYKGCGTILRAHNEPLVTPAYAEDGGEEGEIACLYVIDPAGVPRRVGMAVGNEFSDHRHEKKNYLYLAPSKLRNCALGPELVSGGEFECVPGVTKIERGGEVIWSKEIFTGEAKMSHSLANLEHHHFKFEQHRRPGDAHIHFLGADAFSFGEGVELAEGDVMAIEFEGFGRALRNPLKIDRSPVTLAAAVVL
ncbi:MAG: AraD1 family protein [Bryobacteraceae bacterium]